LNQLGLKIKSLRQQLLIGSHPPQSRKKP
jgi:hypothetical protein